MRGVTLTVPLHPRLMVQGCLGLKSPFIEFSNELEVLANNSIPLNITKDEQALMHQEGLRKLGTFIKPVDLRDSATGYVKADLTKKVYSPGSYGPQTQRRLHPIQEEMDQKQIILLDEDTDENGLPASLTDEDRKFIVPMALKNASPDPRWAQATFRGTTTTTSTTTRAPITTTNKQQQQQQQQQQQRSTTPATPEFASNIEDLKKHILFLQNLTKHDSTFQSKFVVFPSLQKDKQRNSSSATTTTTTTRTPFRPIFQYSAPIIPPTRKSTLNINSKIPQVPPFGGYYHNQNEDDEDSLSQFFAPVNPRDKIAIVPQVLLLNDQNKDRNDKRKSFSILPLPTTTTTTTSTMATTTTTTTTTTTRRPTKPTKLPPCVRNPDSPKCVRQRKREELQRQRDREQLLREQEKYMPRYEPYLQTLNNTKRFAVSIEIPDSFKIPYNESESSKQRAVEENLQILSRFVRSTHKRRNIGGGLTGRSNEKFASKYGSSGAFLDRDAALSAANGRDFVLSNAEQFGMLPVNSSTPTTTVEPYSEPIDLNPDNCYQVEGMTYGQKKQCVLHTSVMPAISRGARAAIQECQFQFKNRRWNCTTIEDNTVFGPMTGLGSPEMAFIHALAAATVTSFIARACRDGQLASCGCSSGSRPKQLNDDWTWGGCGDNLEYAYKFATDFIDVREKETRRGTRGVGNPEKRKNLRLYQTRRQRHHQQQQQMLADDASDFAALPRTVSTVNTNLNGSTTVTKSQQRLSANNGKGKSKSESNNNNNNNYDNSNTATLVSAVAVSIGSINDDIALTRHDIKSLENSNKTVNTEAINLRNTYTDSSSNVNRTTSSVSSYSIQPSSSTTSSSSSSSSSLASLASSSSSSSFRGSSSPSTVSSNLTLTVDAQPLPPLPLMPQQSASRSSFVAVPRQEKDSSEEYNTGRIKPEDLLELQERITKEILNSKLQEKEMLELQEKINREILNSKVFNMDAVAAGATSTSNRRKRKRKNQRAVNGMVADVGGYNSGGSNLGYAVGPSLPVGSSSKWKNSISLKARSLMNLHNNEAGRRAVIKKTRITCKCHGVSGSCSLITCWQQLSSIREIGDYLREKYEESTEVKLNKRGRLQVKDAQFKVPTAHDLIYFDESPDWCRSSRQLQWPGTHGRICNKTSNGLDGCGILCCGRGYNTKSIVVRERCNCKFHWCCQVKCELCVRTIEEHTCK